MVEAATIYNDDQSEKYLQKSLKKSPKAVQVKKISVHSTAYHNKFEAYDFLVRINKSNINSYKDLKDALAKLDTDTVTLHIQRFPLPFETSKTSYKYRNLSAKEQRNIPKKIRVSLPVPKKKITEKIPTINDSGLQIILIDKFTRKVDQSNFKLSKDQKQQAVNFANKMQYNLCFQITNTTSQPIRGFTIPISIRGIIYQEIATLKLKTSLIIQPNETITLYENYHYTITNHHARSLLSTDLKYLQLKISKSDSI
ncbi:hypothetical protein JD969_16635 [Planctomycetota bacterium]|nr:hypothetical protein JD969_16635 [Planctomycetota bacterium]